MTRGHLIAGVEEVEDDPHEAVALLLGVGRELARGLGVALGLEQVALQARVGDEHDAGEGDDRGADRGDEINEDGVPHASARVVESRGRALAAKSRSIRAPSSHSM